MSAAPSGSTAGAATDAGPAARAAIIVNDQPRPLGADHSLAAVVAGLGLAARPGVAVAVNNQVVSRAAWATHALAAGDRVLVIRATQGG